MKTIEELQELNAVLKAELQEARMAQARAETADKNKSVFLANMSHEIRTPLNVIMGFSDLLVSTPDEAERKMYAEILVANCSFLLQLINDILELSKVETDGVAFEQERIDLNGLMNEMLQMMNLRASQEKLELKCVTPLAACLINTEKKELSQVLINLLANAIKFTDEGTIHFGYELRGEKLYFYVSDTGAGIPSHETHRIFERFVRLETSKTGTGLGLSICKALVERMGGEIGVTTELGKGAEFWFMLPYNPA